MSIDKKEHYEKLAQLVREAYSALNAAEAYADEHVLSFNFKPAYGMGGCYYPQNLTSEQIAEFKEDQGWYPSDADNGWQSSSRSC